MGAGHEKKDRLGLPPPVGGRGSLVALQRDRPKFILVHLDRERRPRRHRARVAAIRSRPFAMVHPMHVETHSADHVPVCLSATPTAQSAGPLVLRDRDWLAECKMCWQLRQGQFGPGEICSFAPVRCRPSLAVQNDGISDGILKVHIRLRHDRKTRFALLCGCSRPSQPIQSLWRICLNRRKVPEISAT